MDTHPKLHLLYDLEADTVVEITKMSPVQRHSPVCLLYGKCPMFASTLVLAAPYVGFGCRAHLRPVACDKLHFRRLIFAWTDPGLGNCSYLDTCRHMKGCKYIHYELDDEMPTAGTACAACCAAVLH